MTPCVVAAIDEIFHEDAIFYDPGGGIFRGRDEIDRIAGVIKATHPDFEYRPLFPPEKLGVTGRVRWVSGTPGKPPAYAGTDFIVTRNGRIASVYLSRQSSLKDGGGTGKSQASVVLIHSRTAQRKTVATTSIAACARDLRRHNLAKNTPTRTIKSGRRVCASVQWR